MGFKINNRLYFYSREDDQIKINGFRVELSEIDYYIRKFGALKSITVNINGKIISFVIFGNKDNKKIIDYLKENIEGYKIPSRLIYLKSFPINKNGKIDINLLKKNYIKNEI